MAAQEPHIETGSPEQADGGGIIEKVFERQAIVHFGVLFPQGRKFVEKETPIHFLDFPALLIAIATA